MNYIVNYNDRIIPSKIGMYESNSFIKVKNVIIYKIFLLSLILNYTCLEMTFSLFSFILLLFKQFDLRVSNKSWKI